MPTTRREILAKLLNVPETEFSTRNTELEDFALSTEFFRTMELPEDKTSLTIFYDVLLGESEIEERLRDLVNDVYDDREKEELFGTSDYEKMNLSSVDLTDYLNFEGELEGYQVFSVVG